MPANDECSEREIIVAFVHMTLSVAAMPVVGVMRCLHDVVSVADSGLLCCLVRSDVVRCRFLALRIFSGEASGLTHR